MKSSNQIAIYKLFIHPNDLRELRNDIWCDEPVMGMLTIEKKKYHIDIVYRGSHIRDLDKKSYHLSFYKPKTYRGVKELHLNAEFKDPSLLRNKISFDFFSDIGTLAPQSKFIFLNINGRDEGVYLQLESVDEYFLANRNLPEGAIFYAIDGDANFSLMSDLDKAVKKSLEQGYEKKCGDEEDTLFLQQFIYSINTIPEATFEQEISKYVDIEKYLAWLAGVIFTQNYDGFVHNYALYRNRESQLFEVIPWDYDATWGRDVNGKFMDEGYVPIEGYNTLTARILKVDTFRKQYKQLLEKIMDQQFTIEYMKPKIESLHQLIRPYVLRDRYKNSHIDQFDNEPYVIYQYIEKRREYLKSRLYKLE